MNSLRMYNWLVFVCVLDLFGKIELKQFGDTISTKIIGGESVPVTERPYIVSIHRRHSGFVCGGIIVSSRWMLTALHCIPSPRLRAQYFIRAGSKYYDRGGNFHVIRFVRLYNSSMILDFGTSVPIHDILLIKVFPKFQFSVRTFPAILPQLNEESPKKLWVSGWGVTSSGQLSKLLQSVIVEKVPTNTCQNLSEIYSSFMTDDKHICYGSGEKDSCNGDSGGPLGISRKVYGIVSFGEDCGRLPGVYVKVSFYTGWIKSIIMRDTMINY